ncbi:hypothetical protein [Candidatus Uabimicrobium sp. HlEnr_7]|uniref:hypothetical protein n=1 Tax=Candidatus Uabimicrobium helgolandensis TaxID=3095367 RepID=UPI0035579B4C
MKNFIIYLILILTVLCTVGFFCLTNMVWRKTEFPRQDNCFKTLRSLSTIIDSHLYSNSSPPFYPTDFDSLFAPDGGLTQSNIYSYLSCSWKKGNIYKLSNIFGDELRRGHKPSNIDFCYLYHKSLPIESSTIIAYCPNPHPYYDNPSLYIVAIFCGSKVVRVPLNDFRRQFNLQTKLLTKAQVKFSFNKGIISNNEAGESNEFKKNN